VRKLLGCSAISGEEQLPGWDEAVLAEESFRLEDLPRFRISSQSTELHHRHHTATKWLWWMSEADELRKFGTTVMDDKR
jgi:hypothetical protein